MCMGWIALRPRREGQNIGPCGTHAPVARRQPSAGVWTGEAKIPCLCFAIPPCIVDAVVQRLPT
jgi:hypothetical protein